jgi:CDP-diacylglycerol---serine O-phosphatidyltransferase
MNPRAPDRSRDRRIEDPTNIWIIHPSAAFLLPWFLSLGISANAVSVGGFLIGALAALAYWNWDRWPIIWLGFLLSIAWLIADGLDGMIARAAGTASAVGRFLDGVCDHGVFLLLYVALAASLGTMGAWLLAACAAAAHALQSNLYESERGRFHRRCKGIGSRAPRSPNPILRTYDCVAGLIDRDSGRFDELLRQVPEPAQLGKEYGTRAARPLRLMSLLSANVRVYAIFLACMAGNPRLFWWFELLPLTAILAIGLFWHRAVECRLVRSIRSLQHHSQTHRSFIPRT